MAHLIPFAYQSGTSELHRLDPRVKFFSICLICGALLRADLMPCLGYGLVLILLFKTARIGGFQMLANMKFFLLLLGFIFFFRCLSTPGVPLAGLWGIQVTKQGLVSGFLVSFKFFLVMMTGLLFSVSTRPSGVKAAVQWFLGPVPLVPEKRIAVMIGLSLAFMPVILKQGQKISDAQAARCGNLEKNPVKRIIRLVLPLIKKTFLSADQLIFAMESRCYSDGRTDPEFSVSGKEIHFFTGSLILSTGLIFI